MAIRVREAAHGAQHVEVDAVGSSLGPGEGGLHPFFTWAAWPSGPGQENTEHRDAERPVRGWRNPVSVVPG